jgi:cytochrome c oxidase assembly protein subunit 15
MAARFNVWENAITTCAVDLRAMNMNDEDVWLHRYSIFVALCFLLVLIAGAVVTSLERPISPVPSAPTTPVAISFEHWHSWGAVFAGVLLAGLAVWLMKVKKHNQLRQFGWIVLSIFVVEGALGTALGSLSPLTDILHALIGQICFAAVMAITLFTSERWQRGPQQVEDSWRPPLRSLAFFLPAIVILQIILGAAFRFRAASVIWHILNAMIVLLSILIVCVFLVRQFPQHPSLQPAAIALGGIASVQVFLGFTTFLLLLLLPESSPSVVVVSVMHIATGGLTLAATVALAAQIRYHVVEATVVRH